ncbi:MAG: alpha-1,4 polygalactosaminidase, partial [Pseudomonadota bacterium]
MTEFSIASFNVKNLIGADQEYYRFESYTPEEHAWKEDWLADQLLSMDSDIVCFQEIFDESALRAVVAETNARGVAANAAVVPDRSKRYARKAIFRKLAFDPYEPMHIAFAPNANDGAPGQRRPGLAVLSRFGFVGEPEVIQELPEPLTIPFSDLGGEDGGSYTISRTSRPILKVRVEVAGTVITIFNCHLKSKLGEYPRPAEGLPPEVDLTTYDAAGRALGSLRSALRRMAEAW